MIEAPPIPNRIEDAQQRITRAYRVKFDREPEGNDETTIRQAALRVAGGESFRWEAKGNQPLIRFGLPGEESEEQLQASDLIELEAEDSKPNQTPSNPEQPEIRFKQLQYCRYRACGDSQASAYIKAGYRASNAKSAAVCASQLEKRPNVSKYLQSLRKSSFLANALSLEEKRDFLASVVRTPAGDVDQSSPLCQSYKVSSDGSLEYKLPDKLKALELDAKLAGELREQNTTTNSFNFTMLGDSMGMPEAVADAYVVQPEPGEALPE